eukprot:jgi/Hompol1/3614/HPOL_006647-RA
MVKVKDPQGQDGTSTKNKTTQRSIKRVQTRILPSRHTTVRQDSRAC